MHDQLYRLDLKLEENTRRATVMIVNTCIMGHTVLIRLQRCGSRRDIRGRNDANEILVRHKRYEERDL